MSNFYGAIVQLRELSVVAHGGNSFAPLTPWRFAKDTIEALVEWFLASLKAASIENGKYEAYVAWYAANSASDRQRWFTTRDGESELLAAIGDYRTTWNRWATHAAKVFRIMAETKQSGRPMTPSVSKEFWSRCVRMAQLTEYAHVYLEERDLDGTWSEQFWQTTKNAASETMTEAARLAREGTRGAGELLAGILDAGLSGVLSAIGVPLGLALVLYLVLRR